MKGCISMKKPINDAALKMAIAYAQVEFAQELRTGMIPQSDLAKGIKNMDRFSVLVHDAYEYYADMIGLDRILPLDYPEPD